MAATNVGRILFRNVPIRVHTFRHETGPWTRKTLVYLFALQKIDLFVLSLSVIDITIMPVWVDNGILIRGLLGRIAVLVTTNTSPRQDTSCLNTSTFA